MSKRTRRFLLFLLPVAVVLLGVGLWVIRPPATAITPENAARISVGMTVAEVEAILGGPARDEAPDLAPMRQMIQSVRPDLEWSSDQVSVSVHLDADGRVREARAIPTAPGATGLIPALRRWLRL